MNSPCERAEEIPNALTADALKTNALNADLTSRPTRVLPPALSNTEDDERVEVELRVPSYIAELHREIGDAGINAILRLQLKRGVTAEPSTALLKRAAAALRGALNEAARHICTHDDTHRGGAIWEICDWCGAKWADDEGGKPQYIEPAAVTEGNEVIALLDRAACEAVSGEQPSNGKEVLRGDAR